MTVLVASTARAYKADDERLTHSWLAHADAWTAAGHRLFLALQVGDGHDDRVAPLAGTVEALGGTVWRYTIDEGTAEVGNSQRLAGICAGRNLAHEYAQRDPDVSHILFLDTDIAPPPDAIDRLLEIDNGLVGFYVPTYGLDGARLAYVSAGPEDLWYLTGTANHTALATATGRKRFPDDADVREHELQTAGALMVRRDVFRVLRWRWDIEAGMTDDPCFEHDARTLLGVPTWVRHDVQGAHWPPAIGPFDQRNHDLTIVR